MSSPHAIARKAAADAVVDFQAPQVKKFVRAGTKPAATILVLGAGGLFGSKLCTLLQRIIPQQQFHNPNLAIHHHNFDNNTFATGTTPAQPANYKTSTNHENDHNNNNNAHGKIRIAVGGRRGDVVKKYSIFWNEQLVKAHCKKDAFALEFVPAIVDAKDCQTAEFDKVFAELEPTIVVNATGLRKQELVNLAKVCVFKHGAHFIDLSDDFESIATLEAEMKSSEKHEKDKNRNGVPLVLCATGISTSPAVTGAIIDDVLQKKNTFKNLKSITEGKKGEKLTKNEEDNVPAKNDVNVEIFLAPGMKTHSNDNSFEGQINLEQGVSTTRAVLSRIGEKFHILRNGKVETIEGSFRTCSKLRLPEPIGNRLVSPMDSPDVLLNNNTADDSKKQIQNISFFAGLQVPLLHRLVSKCPKHLAEKLSTQSTSAGKFLGKAFRFLGQYGRDVGGFLVTVETDAKKKSTESVLVIATKGAGTYIPALPAATLIIKLLQATSFGNPSVPNSLLLHEKTIAKKNSNSSENGCVVFSNGVHQHQESLLLPSMSELQQVIDDTLLDITIEQSKCSFQYCINGTGSMNDWSKVHPVVRRFHELQGKNIKLVGFAESPVPPRSIDKLIHKVLRLQHSLPANTEFEFILSADSFSEKWTRKYPTGTMYGELYSEELVIGERKNRRELRCITEKMFGGLLHLRHIPRVDPSTGFIHFDTVQVKALFDLINLPSWLAPSVKAIEGVCPITGRFSFDIESRMPIIGTVIKYKGTIRVDDK